MLTSPNLSPSQLYLTVSNDDSVYVQPYHPLGTPLTRPSESPPSSSASPSSSPGSPSQPPSYASLPYPIILHPNLRLSDVFYDASPSAGSNLLGMLKSPMVLMLIFTGIMAFAMPKILENLEVDPEDAKSVKEMRDRFQSVQTTDWGERYVHVPASERFVRQLLILRSCPAEQTGRKARWGV